MKIERMDGPKMDMPKRAPAAAVQRVSRPPHTGGAVLSYYLRDVQDGIRRNAGAAIATILLIFISLTLTGAMVLLAAGVDDVIRYLNDQVKIKVFVDPEIDTEEAARILKETSFVKSVEIETRDDALDKLQRFFRDMPHLFDSFRDSKLPDAILIEITDSAQANLVAEQLESDPGYHRCDLCAGIRQAGGRLVEYSEYIRFDHPHRVPACVGPNRKHRDESGAVPAAEGYPRQAAPWSEGKPCTWTISLRRRHHRLHRQSDRRLRRLSDLLLRPV